MKRKRTNKVLCEMCSSQCEQRLERNVKFCSRKCYGASIKGIRDSDHHNWKGDNIKNPAVHRWVQRWKGYPKKCEVCGTEEKRKYEWANIDHKYRRVLEDYIRMCTPCHRNYDIKNNNYKK